MIPDSPYKGLVPFEDSGLDALLFFGRARESSIIAENLLATRLTVLYGPSGVGKTSVLRAGVAQYLRRQAEINVEKRGHPEFTALVFDVWNEEPTESLRATVRDALAAQFGSALLDEREGEPLAETLGRWTDALACDLLVILDQAEEYFLYHQAESGFAVELPELVTQPALRVRVLLSVRDDALSKLDRFKGRIPNLFANYLRLDHLDRQAAREAVVRPVERFNELAGESIQVEPALVEAVLDQTAAGQVDFGAAGRGLGADEASAGRIEAAYLQLVLERLWQEERSMGSDVLRAETLAALGGAESIVRAHLRRAVEELTAEERDVAADVFRFLVTPSGAKVAHGASDLAEYASVDEQRLVPVLSTLGRERILRTVDGAGADAARYEIFHDVLGEAVLVWRGEQELDRERRAAERRHRRLALVALFALIALAAMTAVAIYALAQRREAQAQRREAQDSARKAQARELVARSSDLLNEDPLDGVALAARAARLEPTAGSEAALRIALLASRARRILHAGTGGVNAASYSPDSALVVTADADGAARIFATKSSARLALMEHDSPVTDASFSPDGKILATASRDRTVRLWNRNGGPIRTLRHDAAVLDLEFSPDQRSLVTATGAGTVHIWGLDPGESHEVLTTPRPARVTISSDGEFLAVVGADRFARVYSLPFGAHAFDLPHDSRVLSAAFGPHELLATGSANKTARTWDLRQRNLGYRFRGHFGRVAGVAVSPQGQFVGTASSDNTARIWDIAERGATQSILNGHTGQVHTVEFSPRGLYVVTASRDGKAIVWQTDRGRQVAVLAGHEGDVRGAVFSTVGRRVLTYSEDGTARIWDPGTTAELRVLAHQKAPLIGADVARNGRLRVTTDENGIARIWDQGARTVTLPARKVRDAALNPDGTLVATASGDRFARIWTREGVSELAFRVPGRVDAVAFSPDGRTLAAAGLRGIALLALKGGPKRLRMLDAGPSIVRLSFSPDGTRLVTADADATGQIWNLATGRREHVLSGHRDRLTSARFSPDGTLVVTASADHDAMVWDVRTGKMLDLLRGHGAIVSDAAFSADGRWIVTAGPGTAGLWEVRTRKLLTFLRGHVGILTSAEFGEEGYDVFTAGEDGTVRTYACDVCAPLPGLLALADKRLTSLGVPPR